MILPAMTSIQLTRSVLVVVACLGTSAAAVEQKSGPEGPRKIKHVEPPYPRESLRRGDEGMVILEVNVQASGTVEHARVLWSGCDRFNESALKAVREWRYEAMRLDGKPTPWSMTLSLPFRLPERLRSRAGHPGACQWKEGPTPLR
jgi:TonB family protein